MYEVKASNRGRMGGDSNRKGDDVTNCVISMSIKL
nr:MAG TPA: hypothetical protein [Caudoviricetes sp.]